MNLQNKNKAFLYLDDTVLIQEATGFHLSEKRTDLVPGKTKNSMHHRMSGV